MHLNLTGVSASDLEALRQSPGGHIRVEFGNFSFKAKPNTADRFEFEADTLKPDKNWYKSTWERLELKQENGVLRVVTNDRYSGEGMAIPD